MKIQKLILQVTRGPHAGQSLDFSKTVVSIGRGSENDVVFPEDVKCSRKHAEINWDGHNYRAKNISQKNFILVNGEKTEETILKNGDHLIVGDTELKIVLPGMANLHPVAPATAENKNVVANPPRFPHNQNKPAAPVPPRPAAKPSASPFSNPSVNPNMVNNSRSGSEGFFSGRVRFYTIVAIIGIAAFWFFSGSSKSKKPDMNIRTSEQIQKDLEKSKLTLDAIQRQRMQSGTQGMQYESAQAYYIKGFRDYRQGQYARAILSFQAALSFYPDHTLAKRYLTLSKRKFDEIVQFNMNQGKNYREQGNYRLCKSAYKNVIIMLKDPNDKIYQQAKTYYDECSTAVEGKY